MPPRRTKIVATLGPASRELDQIQALLLAGVDVCRINCSHASHDGIREAVARIRRAASILDRPVGILLDLQGPKIRTSKVVAPLPLQRGDILTVRMDDTIIGSGLIIGTTYTRMAQDVKPGDMVLFADGALSGQVSAVRREINPAEVDIRIEDAGELGSHKGINLPGVATSVPSLTEKDIADLAGCDDQDAVHPATARAGGRAVPACIACRRAYSPFMASSCGCVPDSTTRP